MAAPTGFLAELVSDIRSPRCLPGISIGLVVSLVLIVVEVSFATMIFSGPLEVHVRKGMGMALAGTVGFALCTALFSRIRSIVALPQDAPAALFAGVAAAIAAAMDCPEAPETFITITAALMVACLITGVFFFLIGRFRWAEFFRFMPYPVVSGFLAGTGWLLTKGSLEVMTGRALTWSSLSTLASAEVLALWLPGAAYAVALFFILRRWSHYLVLPGSLVLAVFCYHGVLRLAGISIAEARQLGFIFESFATGSLWPVFGLADMATIDWAAIWPQVPAIAVIPFISLLGLLLNTGGIELASRREIDMNRELVVNGAANALIGATGAHPGYASISLSALGLRVGADTRLVGLTAALMLVATLLFGSQVLAFFPKAILGGFLLLLGLFFLSDWLVDTRKKMPAGDHLLVVAVFLVICVFSYLHGVIFGLLATMTLFVIRISRVPILRQVQSGAHLHSRKGRPLPQQRLLAMHGERIAVYELEGYVFFGSVTRLIEDISAAVKNPARAPVEAILLDFRGVNGFDISSVNNFVRLIHRFQRPDLIFAFCGPPPGFQELLVQHLDPETTRSLRFFPDRESALQWAEDRLLEKEQQLLRSASMTGKTARETLLEDVSDELMRRLEWQSRVEALMERLGGYLEDRRYAKDEVVLAGGGEAEGLYLVRGGVVAEEIEAKDGGRTRVRELGPGTLFAEMAVYANWRSSSLYVARSQVVLGLLTPEALVRLEAEAPVLANTVHRLLMVQHAESTAGAPSFQG
ncbi:MAG: SulP family inorganic anion transporter [Desulfobacterales bacterium]|jgi:SulP family sulfate permease|nr:SulP family inorganic anion transporter [Desulfobacteraceae bacterium]MDY0312156.1 SulP family inorganic anion transporter [Desulfobacterales bacterium]